MWVWRKEVEANGLEKYSQIERQRKTKKERNEDWWRDSQYGTQFLFWACSVYKGDKTYAIIKKTASSFVGFV